MDVLTLYKNSSLLWEWLCYVSSYTKGNHNPMHHHLLYKSTNIFVKHTNNTTSRNPLLLIVLELWFCLLFHSSSTLLLTTHNLVDMECGVWIDGVKLNLRLRSKSIWKHMEVVQIRGIEELYKSTIHANDAENELDVVLTR